MKAAPVFLSLLLAMVSHAQQQNSGSAKSTGKCSPPVTGSNNTVILHCDTVKDAHDMQKLLQMMHDTNASTAELSTKVDEVLAEMKRTHTPPPSMGDLAERTDDLVQAINGELCSYGFDRHSMCNKTIRIKEKRPSSQDRQALEDWHWDISEEFRHVYLARVRDLRKEYADLHYSDDELNLVLQSINMTENDPVHRMILVGPIEIIAERLQALAGKLPKQ
jgi:hypothetical protein